MTSQMNSIIIGEKTKLSGHNYKEWKFLIRSIFQGNGL